MACATCHTTPIATAPKPKPVQNNSITHLLLLLCRLRVEKLMACRIRTTGTRDHTPLDAASDYQCRLRWVGQERARVFG
jgi:hypothetical protein